LGSGKGEWGWGWESGSRELHGVRPVEPKAPVLSADVAGVHVPVQFLVVAALGVDVSHEGPSGGCLVGGAGHDHPDADVLSGHAVHLILDEAVGGVHLASGLAVGTLEGVLAFKGGAAVEHGGITVPSVGHCGTTETCEEPQLAGVDLPGEVCRHVDGWVVWLGDVVLRHRLRASDDGDLDVAVDCFGCDLGGAQT